jgi:hypothetical protein
MDIYELGEFAFHITIYCDETCCASAIFLASLNPHLELSLKVKWENEAGAEEEDDHHVHDDVALEAEVLDGVVAALCTDLGVRHTEPVDEPRPVRRVLQIKQKKV